MPWYKLAEGDTSIEITAKKDVRYAVGSSSEGGPRNPDDPHQTLGKGATIRSELVPGAALWVTDLASVETKVVEPMASSPTDLVRAQPAGRA